MGCLPLTFKMAQKPANLFSIFAFEAQEHSCHGGLGDDREKQILGKSNLLSQNSAIQGSQGGPLVVETIRNI